MRVVKNISVLRAELAIAPDKSQRVGLVPTMGYFHEGHLSLMRTARNECDLVVVTLFVNPSQFRPGEDLGSYPSNFERDRQLAEKCGADLLFCPDQREMYGTSAATQVSVLGLTEVLCGAPEYRGPQHFHGVTTVVAKLFNIVQPDVAYFGQKDAQQVRVIEQMIRDLNFPIEIRVLPTAREADGVAMSSRNTYLTDEQRSKATAINRSLKIAEELILGGELNGEQITSRIKARLLEAGLEVEYVEAVDASTLESLEVLDGEVLIAVAVRVGEARLIDNLEVRVSVDASLSGTADRSLVGV